MKKQLLTLLFFLFFNSLFSQVFTIFDTQKDEVYGYMVFEFVEKADKKTNTFMITLLDVNLHKVAQKTFNDARGTRIGRVVYNGSSLFIEVANGYYTSDTRYYGYRIYDLKSNTISERFVIPEKHKKIEVIGCFPIVGKGYGIMVRNYKNNLNHFYAVSDKGNQELYTIYPFGNPKKKKQIENLFVADNYKNTLVTINKIFKKRKAKDYRTVMQIYNIDNGELIKEVSLDTDLVNIDINNVNITDDNIYVYGDTYLSKNKITSGKTNGIVKVIMDQNGEVIDTKYRVWEDFQSKIKIKEGGFVQKNGYIYTHTFTNDKKTGHTIVVGEYIKGGVKSLSVNDMVFLDFDENFELQQVYEVAKKSTSVILSGIKFGGSRGYGSFLKYNNYFDYRFYNYLENESGLCFYYFNVEKARNYISGGDYAHGIVVYKDGKFSNSKLKWEESYWHTDYLNLLPSKPGYILLSRVIKNKVENRLEKIDY